MNNNNDISIMQILKGVALGFIVAIGLSLLHPHPIPLMTGIVFGLILSLLNFRLLYITLSKAVQMPPGKAKVYTASQYILRYIVIGFSLFISIQAPYINVIGTILGILLLKIVIFISNISSSRGVLKEAFTRKKNT